MGRGDKAVTRQESGNLGTCKFVGVCLRLGVCLRHVPASRGEERSFDVPCSFYLAAFVDGYCSTLQALLDCFELHLGFTDLLCIQIELCVMCLLVLYSPVSLSS